MSSGYEANDHQQKPESRFASIRSRNGSTPAMVPPRRLIAGFFIA
jgi:hypothetical protein